VAGGVPGELWLVESFLNSVDVESGADDLGSVAQLQRWLADHQRGEAGARATEEDLILARAVRDHLRELLAGHAEGEHAAAQTSAGLGQFAERVPLRATFHGGVAGLAPAAGGVLGVLGEVLAGVVLAERDGTWRRLKLCREGTCQVAFYDRSKNASRCWCSMQVCGNRNKTRAYRQRASANDEAGAAPGVPTLPG
jgi:predicted RNA-binding Zn ribbon-like protein